MNNLKGRLRSLNIFDFIIFMLSNNSLVSESLIFKTWLFFKRKKYISSVSPVIIGGCPRSGTTLARALLSMHQDIAAPCQEFNLLMWINKKKILKNKLGFSVQEIQILSEYKDHILLAENIIKTYQKKCRKKIVLLKHPFHILIIDNLFKFFPCIKFIHIIRDGRDTSCSLRTHPKRKIINGEIKPIITRNPFSWCIRRWVCCINQGKKWRSSKNYIEIKYEDLVYDTVRTVNKITDFLKIEKIPEKQILDFYKYEQEEKHIQNIEVSKPIYTKTIGRWKKELSEKEKKTFKHKAGKFLIELGYENDSKW